MKSRLFILATVLCGLFLTSTASATSPFVQGIRAFRAGRAAAILNQQAFRAPVRQKAVKVEFVQAQPVYSYSYVDVNAIAAFQQAKAQQQAAYRAAQLQALEAAKQQACIQSLNAKSYSLQLNVVAPVQQHSGCSAFFGY